MKINRRSRRLRRSALLPERLRSKRTLQRKRKKPRLRRNLPRSRLLISSSRPPLRSSRQLPRRSPIPRYRKIVRTQVLPSLLLLLLLMK